VKINHTQQNSFKGNAFLVDAARNSFLDLQIKQHQEKLYNVSKKSIKKVNELISKKPFDLFVLKGADTGEYLFYANTSFKNVLKSKPKFVLPTVYKVYEGQLSNENNFVKSAKDAIDRFNIVF